ncbi:MAG: C39 family peptidase [Thermomicrobiales bacterium]|nr:C39 family peptidase [Thermomicrobiales bacterium]
MATAFLSHQHAKIGRFPRKLGVVAVLLVLGIVVWQSGLVTRIPGQYIPDAIEQHIPTSGTHSSVMLPGAYLYQQQRPLSCEYASATIAATMGGWNITEYDFDTVVPLSENPHKGYRGNIWGEWGNTTDYGIYANPLQIALSGWGIPSHAFYADGDPELLKQELAAGRPVVVWLAIQGTVNSFDAYEADGTRYQLTQYMHVMTAYGYDESGVYLTDPGTAVWRYYDWATFMSMWNVMDGMALSIEPRTISSVTDTFEAFIRYR